MCSTQPISAIATCACARAYVLAANSAGVLNIIALSTFAQPTAALHHAHWSGKCYNEIPRVACLSDIVDTIVVIRMHAVGPGRSGISTSNQDLGRQDSLYDRLAYTTWLKRRREEDLHCIASVTPLGRPSRLISDRGSISSFGVRHNENFGVWKPFQLSRRHTSLHMANLHEDGGNITVCLRLLDNAATCADARDG